MRQLLLGLNFLLFITSAIAQNKPTFSQPTSYQSGYLGDNYNSVVALSENKILVLYSDGGVVKGKIGTIESNSITFGKELYFSSSNPYSFEVKKLSESSFIYLHVPSGSSNSTILKVGYIQNDQVSFGKEHILFTYPIRHHSVTVLNEKKFLVACQIQWNMGRCFLAEINDQGEVSIKSSKDYLYRYSQSGAEPYVSIDTLSSNKFIIAFGYFIGQYVMGSISTNNVISLGDTVTFNENETYFISMEALDESRIAMAYSELYGSQKNTITIGTVSGSHITFGEKYTTDVGKTYEHTIIKLNEENVAWSFKSYSEVYVLNTKIKGSEVSISPHGPLLTSSMQSTISRLTDSTFALIYQSIPDGGFARLVNINTQVYGNISSPGTGLVSVFPNPFENELSIQLTNQHNSFSAEVYSLTGQRIDTCYFATNKASLNLADLPEGIYYLRIKTPDGIYSRKVIKSF